MQAGNSKSVCKGGQICTCWVYDRVQDAAGHKSIGTILCGGLRPFVLGTLLR